MLKKAVEPHYAEMSFDQLLGWLRVSGYDGQVFAGMFPTLERLLPSLNEERQLLLYTALCRVWALAYPIGESFNLPLALGKLFAALSYPTRPWNAWSARSPCTARMKRSPRWWNG